MTLPVKPDKSLPRYVELKDQEEDNSITKSSNHSDDNDSAVADSHETSALAEPTAKSKAKIEKDKAQGHDKWVNRDALREKEEEAKRLKDEIQTKMKEAETIASVAKSASDNVDKLKEQLTTEEAKLEDARRQVDSSIASISDHDGDKTTSDGKKHVKFAKVDPQNEEIITNDDVDFVEAPSYRGMRKGFVFKKGEKGLGMRFF